MEIKIYLLRDPSTLDIRYIGKTTQTLPARLVEHIHESYFRKRAYVYKKAEWLQSLFNSYTLPVIELIEIVPFSLAENREKYWIEYYKDIAPLLNFVYNTNNTWERLDLRIPVYQYSKEGDFIKKWESIYSVTQLLKLPSSNIVQACKSKRKLAGDYMWRYYQIDKLKRYKKDLYKKPVFQYSLTGDFISGYDSARDCTGFSYKNISQCCKGEKGSHKGFQWSFDKVNNIGIYSKQYNYVTKQI